MALSLLDACDDNGSPPLPDANDLTGMHFFATALPPNPAPTVDISVGYAHAQTIYRLTRALPEQSSGVFNCPLDFGVFYNLAFFDGAGTTVTATVEPTGCRLVRFLGQGGLQYVGDANYWEFLAVELGIPESTIYPFVPQ